MASESNRSLNVSFGLNTSEFSKGIAELKQELSNLNAKFTENKQKITDTSKELKDLHEQQKKLTAEIEKNGDATEEQKEQMQELAEKIAQTTAKMGQLKAEEADIKSGIKTATKELQNQRAELNDNTKSATLLHQALDKLGTAAKAFIGVYGAKKLWELLIGSNEEMEQYQTSFEVMLGDAEKAKNLITDIQSFAAKTPLSKSDSVSIGSLLMNYGVEADEVIDKMTKLGDLAGGNAEKMNRIALAYGQMLAKGKVTGEELRQMTEAGVPLQNALAESIGVTGDEFSKMVSKGQVGIEELDKAIEELTTGNGKFAGMMEKQSQTMQGMLSTLQDNVSEFFRQMGEGAFGEIKDVLAELMDQLKEWEEDGTLQEWAEKLGTTISDLIKLLKSAIEILFKFGDEIVAVMAGKGVYNAADKLIKKFTELKDKLSELGVKGVAENVKAGVNMIASSINPLALLFATVGTKIYLYWQQIKKTTDVTEEYNNAINRIEKSSNSLISKTQDEISVLENKVERYDELRTAAELTAEQRTELKSIAEELQGVFGDEIDVVNRTTGAYNDLTGALEAYTQQKLMQAKADASYNTLTLLYQEQAEYKDKIKAEFERIYQANFSDDEFQSILDGIALEYKNKTVDPIDALTPIGESKAIYIAYANVTDKIKEVEKAYTDFNSTLYKTSTNANKAADSYEQIEKAIEANREAADKLADSLKNVNSAYLEQKEKGKLSYDTIMSLVDAGYASCLEIDEETKAVKLNTDAYRELARAKLEARMTDLKTEIEKNTTEIETEYHKKIVIQATQTNNPSYVEVLEEKQKEAIDAATAEAKAELAALRNLYDNIDSYVKAEHTSSSAPKSSALVKKETDEVKEAVDQLAKSLKSVNSAYLEQQKNGKLSYDTAMSLINAGYASCLETDEETKAVRLNTEAYKELARAKINARMNALKSGEITKEIKNELAVLQELRDNIESYVTADNSTPNSKKETVDYSAGYEAYKTEADKKLALISKELAAKKELRDKTIAYLDEEIKKRKELNQDDDMQREIDKVAAQLKYAQLDDFSRAQLEKKLKDLKEEQSEILWERDIQKRKEAANQAYDEAAASTAEIQEQINNSIATVKQIMEALKDGVTNINNVINSNNSTVTNNANISLANQYLTMAQITKAVRDALIGDVTILTR